MRAEDYWNNVFQEEDAMTDMQYFLDSLIEQRNDLGDLGKEIEKLLRLAGVTASTDPKLPNHYH